jgi:hypothetical protein
VEDVEKFLGGQTYLNVHSTANPTGEVRGQALTGVPTLLIAGAGVGGGPHVRVFDVRTGNERFSFFPYDPGYRGGVRVTSCDLDDDGTPDIVTATGVGGAPHIRVFDGLSGQELPDVGGLSSFFAFDPGFTGGTTVACADVDGDGRNDVIVAAGQGGAPNVATFSGYATGAPVNVSGPLGNFFPFDPGFLGGTFVGSSP